MINTNYSFEKQQNEPVLKIKKAKETPKTEKQKSLRAVDLAWSLGFILLIPQLAGVFFGLFLDRKFGTKPLFIIVFLTVGLVVGILAMVRRVKRDF